MRPAVRSSANMALGTVVSRMTGMVRLTLQGAALGGGLLATTYNTANTVPNSLYFLLIGGALNSVLVPQLVRARIEQPDGGCAYEQRLVTLVLTLLAAATALAVWAAPQIVGVYVSDSARTHTAYELTVVFARFLIPQILFYGMFFILGQVLGARERFGAATWTPVLNNVVLIAMFGLYLGLVGVPRTVQEITSAEVRLLGVGSTLALALQALSLVPYAHEAGLRFRPRFEWRHTGLRRAVVAARWTLLFVLVNQVALTVVTRYAGAADGQSPQAGVGYTAYSYAYNVWTLPQSIITVSVATALLPGLSRAVAEQRLDDVRDSLSRALRITGLAIVPAAFFLVAFGPQISALLFAHGAATPAQTLPGGRMLQAFGLGLVPFSAQYLLLRGFYAFEDTRTPFWTAVWISGADIVLATACHMLLPVRWAVVGMAGAYTVSYGTGLLVTAVLLRRRLEGRLDGARLCRTYGKLAAAALPAAAAGWAVSRVASSAAAPALQLLAGGAVMACLFLLLARALRIGDLRAGALRVLRHG